MEQNETEAIRLFKMSAEQVTTGFQYLLSLTDTYPQICVKLQDSDYKNANSLLSLKNSFLVSTPLIIPPVKERTVFSSDHCINPLNYPSHFIASVIS